MSSLTRRPHGALTIAFAASVALHGALYFATPRYFAEFTPARAVRYDASLTPAERVMASATPLPVQKKRRLNPKQITVPEPPANAHNEALPDALPPALPTMAATAPDEPPTHIEPPVAITPTPAPAAAAVAAATAAAKHRAPVFAERISIEYKLTSAIADGVANFRWMRRGNDYEIESSTQATGFFAAALTGVIHQQSSGTITDEGLRPSQFSLRRGEGEAETAEFNRGNNSLTFKRRNVIRSVPLARDMQDMQSFLFQLAYDAPRLAESNDKLDVLVTNARKVYRYQFKKIGVEIVETRFGAIEAIRLLSDAANPEDAYEVWLAPRYFHLPVKIKMYLGRFPFEQLVTRIGVSEDAAAMPATPPGANTAK